MFEPGKIVCLKADKTKTGSIISVLTGFDGIPKYRVFHSDKEIRDYLAEQLELLDISPTGDHLIDAIQAYNWLTLQDFQARLTAIRLDSSQNDNLYAFQAARIQYIPFQYKPLLRFLRADQPRLFIADEVGVGKTIEAGLILKELQARQKLDNILILCPKALVTKWREEMRRFDEDFRPLSSENLQYCINETNLDGVWPAQYARSIIHLELMRQDQHLFGVQSRRYPKPGLVSLDPAPHFNLLIVDEAHHVRNPETLSNELARFLCEISDAVVFLSATPVHVGSENLYNLLHLLRPDLFSDFNVFQEMVEPNQHIIQAMRNIRLRQPTDRWQADAANSLRTAVRTSWGQDVILRDPLAVKWLDRLPEAPPLSDSERITCIRDLEEMHTLAHVMNRTRRRDIGRFTIREPHTVSVAFTEDQQVFYDALIDFRRQVLLQQYDPRVVGLITDTLQRQAASCLPALVPALNAFIHTGRFSTASVSDDPELDEIDYNLQSDLVDQAIQLRETAQNLPEEDPKLDQLLTIINESLNGTGSQKILIFSFFLHTLNYLRDKLYQRGYRVALITGKTVEQERETLRNQFRSPREEPESIDILLSSEVGCEGLDYEFCDRLVNYDIPWNPMRIEQRIGRIDRFGQQSEKVLIFNFITPGTVEERIFYRCFDRLGIFRETVGDLEEVLGDLVQDLTQIAMDPGLSPEQAEQKAQQVSDNLLRRLEEEKRLEEESGDLLGIDQSFTEEVNALVDEGRFVSHEALRSMIASFIEQPDIDGKLLSDEKNPEIYRLRLRRSSRQMLLERLPEEDHPDRTTLTFKRWLQGDEPFLVVTFDQNVALEYRQMPFITPVHPLARAAVKYWMGKQDPLVTVLRVQDQEVKAGRYLFICELWDYLGLRTENRLTGLCWDLDHNVLAEDVSSQLVRLISKKESETIEFSHEQNIEEQMQKLDQAAGELRQATLLSHQERNDFLIARKTASLETWYQTRLKRLAAELSTNLDERIRRMKESEQSRLERELDQKRKEIMGKSIADITTQRIAAGILEVCGDE